MSGQEPLEPEDLEGLTEEEREQARDGLRLDQARRTNSELRRMNRFLTEELKAQNEKIDLLLEVHAAPDKPYKIRSPKGGRKKTPVVSCSMASDLHVEEVVDPKTVNGLNEHNLEIAEDKLFRYWRNVVRLVKKEQAEADIQTHIQWIGGDLFTGHIHEEFPEITELSPTQAVLWLRPRIRDGIRFLRKELDVPEILVPWSYGNHGRTTIRPRVATAADHSYEWMLGQIIAEDLKGDDGIKVLVANGYHLYVDCDGYTVRFHHGDWLNYQGGVGGLTIPLNKAIDSWNKTRPANLDVLGHWHQWMDLQYALVNGSLIGFSPYALRIKARYEPPRQGFFLIDLERKEKTGSFPVHVT